MNGFGNRRGGNGLDTGRPPMLQPDHLPSGKSLLDGYRKDFLTGSNGDITHFNPMNPDHPQSSVLLDLKDPVQVHLLTETALFDSKEYVILSPEEVDDLKKQCQILSQRIQATRSQLAIQSKYRDAAISMAKLYSPGRAEGKRRSLLGNRHSGGDAAREAEEERQQIEHRCETLAQELWSLERRMMEPQRRLLQHTAAILQMTHKANKKSAAPVSKAPLTNGIPASPESLYTYSNGRNSLEPPDDLLFDEGNIFQSMDQLEGFSSIGRPRKNSIQIPVKSPIREQNKQLVEEGDKLRDENNQLRSQTDALHAELDSLRRQGSEQMRLLSDTERKLEKFNLQLREVIINTDPSRNGRYSPAPAGSAEPGDMLGSHLEYLERGLSAVSQGQGNNTQAAESIQEINTQMQDVLLTVDPNYPSPPAAPSTLDDQLAYLQDSLRVVDEELQRAADISSSSNADRQKTEQSETVLMGLWEIIQSGYADIKQRKEDRRRTRLEKGLEDEEDDLSDSESFDPNEPYSLSAFSNKVQWLYAQATSLKEQKSVLKRQVKQQRDLNSKSDGEKDKALQLKVDELDQTRQLLSQAEKEAEGIRMQLSETLDNLESTQKALDAAEAEAAEAAKSVQAANSTAQAASSSVQKEIKEREAKIASLEAALEKSNNDLQKKIEAAESKAAATEAKVADIMAQLEDAQAAKADAEKALVEAQRATRDKEDELEQMNADFVVLKMEATMAKAELDGAYGSRRERAADAAALITATESAKYSTEINKLKRELAEQNDELLKVTQQGIATEKLIADLESQLDAAKSGGSAEQVRLEFENTELAEEKSKLEQEVEQLHAALDRERLRLATGPASPGLQKTSATLTDSYRAGLRDQRNKYEAQLKEATMMRRKMEEEIRTLRRAAGPGKSPLSPRP